MKPGLGNVSRHSARIRVKALKSTMLHKLYKGHTPQMKVCFLSVCSTANHPIQSRNGLGGGGVASASSTQKRLSSCGDLDELGFVGFGSMASDEELLQTWQGASVASGQISITFFGRIVSPALAAQAVSCVRA